ncbi:hypothetical protein GCM10023085_34790 [Actinomadura viridis]
MAGAYRSTHHAVVVFDPQAATVSDSALTMPILTARELSRRFFSCGGKANTSFDDEVTGDRSIPRGGTTRA